MSKKTKKINQRAEKKNTVEAKTRKPLPEFVSKRLSEGLFLAALAVSTFLILALLTYDPLDGGWSRVGNYSSVENAGGTVGAWLADVSLFVFGYFAYLFPILFVYFSWLWLRRHNNLAFDYRVFLVRFFGFMLLLVGGCSLADMGYFSEWPLALPHTEGGLIGHVMAHALTYAFNPIGASLFALTLFLAGMTLFAGLSWLQLFETVGRFAVSATQRASRGVMSAVNCLGGAVSGAVVSLWRTWREWTVRRRERTVQRKQASHHIQPKLQQAKMTKPRKKPLVIEATQIGDAAPSRRYEQDRQADLFAQVEGGLPSLSLLEKAEEDKKEGYSAAKLEEMSREVEQRLLDFGVEAQVVAVHPGPVITRFELQLAPGVKASKITGLASDLARSLSMVSVRVVEVIPGKPVVGLELPNKQRQMVRLCEVLATDRYEQARSPLSLAMGVDIAGHPVIVDLAKMPHMLVAGTTGSGKSVGLNAMLLSLLFKSTPEQVRLIMIDPKMLELSVYEGIPHLLTPVVTDMNEAANSLRWSVAEMERRYRLMAALGVRNISGYNNKVKEAQKQGTPIKDPLYDGPANEGSDLQALPMIVVVIDELADMMMVVGKKVEQLIARIAQKARASGIHLILATQRPSVDVLTGLIKSNIPTRVSFQVSSKIDSRTILDQQGAEQLLGHGDMLYLAPGTGAPVRIHGAFVDDDEVHRVAADWKRRGAPDYLEEILGGPEASNNHDFAFLGEASDSDTEDADPLYDEAVQFVIQSRKASISSVQRRLKIGYNRAARLVEEMERVGVVSPMESNGNRQVLVSAQE